MVISLYRKTILMPTSPKKLRRVINQLRLSKWVRIFRFLIIQDSRLSPRQVYHTLHHLCRRDQAHIFIFRRNLPIRYIRDLLKEHRLQTKVIWAQIKPFLHNRLWMLMREQKKPCSYQTTPKKSQEIHFHHKEEREASLLVGTTHTKISVGL